jgi:ribosomal peptide maturation radical SAM protein 1
LVSDDNTPVCLVSMPWAPPHEPSLGLGILKACLEQAGIRSHVLHAAPQLMRWTTSETYQFLADCWGINEFLFSGDLDCDLDESQKSRLLERLEHYAAGERHERYADVESLWKLVFHMRNEVVPSFLDVCTQLVLSYSPKIVGFTCLFDQTIASVALARRLKRLDPSIAVVFGGYALQGTAGDTVGGAFPWIDVIALGDGERIVVEIAEGILSGGSARSVVGSPKIIRGATIDMESSPTPDYTDWFSDAVTLAHEHKVELRTRVLPVEASRGCWWGQTKHCVFCGIDDEALKYRFKKPETTLSMLREMRDRYGDHVFRFSDYIMPKVYYSDLLPVLAAEEPRFRLQGELKANHPPERVKLLADAGFHEVQPGIESFSTPVLRAMDKGVRGIDNISLLKAGYTYRVVIDYNVLYGLPSDTLEMYLPIVENLPRLYHLMPPVSRNETVVTRFAPLQMDPGRFGIASPAVHHVSYDVLFSSKFLSGTGFSLDSYAYYFERNFPYDHDVDIAYSQLVQQIDHWKEQHRSRFVELSYTRKDDHLEVCDSRFGEAIHYDLSPSATAIYLACDVRPVDLEKVKGELAETGAAANGEFELGLQELDERRLIWTEGKLVLGLAIDSEIALGHRITDWPQSWMALFT